jgi:hypothetical protein
MGAAATPLPLHSKEFIIVLAKNAAEAGHRTGEWSQLSIRTPPFRTSVPILKWKGTELM